jgi:hypothetical protein
MNPEKLPIYADSDSDIDIQLPQDTKMMFETENNELIEQLEGTLNLVRCLKLR